MNVIIAQRDHAPSRRKLSHVQQMHAHRTINGHLVGGSNLKPTQRIVAAHASMTR